MADANVRLVSDAANTGKYVDVSELTVGATTVERQRVNLADPTSATAIMAVKAASTAAALTDPAAVVSLSPNSPVTRAKFRDLDDAPQAAIKASAGVLFGVQVINTTGASAYLQIFNAAADVTLGTEEPVMEFLVEAGKMVTWWADRGVAFATGIRAASTTTEKGSTGSAAGVMLFAQYV
jgi:hypothetical protein